MYVYIHLWNLRRNCFFYQNEEYKEKNILILIYCFISYYIKRFLEQEKNYVC